MRFSSGRSFPRGASRICCTSLWASSACPSSPFRSSESARYSLARQLSGWERTTARSTLIDSSGSRLGQGSLKKYRPQTICGAMLLDEVLELLEHRGIVAPLPEIVPGGHPVGGNAGPRRTGRLALRHRRRGGGEHGHGAAARETHSNSSGKPSAPITGRRARATLDAAGRRRGDVQSSRTRPAARRKPMAAPSEREERPVTAADLKSGVKLVAGHAVLLIVS